MHPQITWLSDILLLKCNKHQLSRRVWSTLTCQIYKDRFILSLFGSKKNDKLFSTSLSNVIKYNLHFKGKIVSTTYAVQSVTEKQNKNKHRMFRSHRGGGQSPAPPNSTKVIDEIRTIFQPQDVLGSNVRFRH